MQRRGIHQPFGGKGLGVGPPRRFLPVNCVPVRLVLNCASCAIPACAVGSTLRGRTASERRGPARCQDKVIRCERSRWGLSARAEQGALRRFEERLARGYCVLCRSPWTNMAHPHFRQGAHRIPKSRGTESRLPPSRRSQHISSGTGPSLRHTAPARGKHAEAIQRRSRRHWMAGVLLVMQAARARIAQRA